jgi:tetratricopeptide (TPR) repeat protein
MDTRDAAAHIALARGDTAAAIRLFEQANADPDRWLPVRRLALLYWSRGDARQAERVLAPFEQLVDDAIGDVAGAELLYGVALLHAVRGDMDAAAAHLERARLAGLSVQTLEVAPLPAALLRDARLRRIRDGIYTERERQRERARREGWL